MDSLVSGLPIVYVWADESCLYNPAVGTARRGGSAGIVQAGDSVATYSHADADTTNTEWRS